MRRFPNALILVLCGFLTYGFLAAGSAWGAEGVSINPNSGAALEEVRRENSSAEKSPTETLEEAVSESQDLRRPKHLFGSFDYSPLDLLIPNKFGLTLGINEDANHSWELEYLRGTISIPFLIEDLGGFRDEKISVIRRTYFGNSFNLSYGLTYFRFRLRLGSEVISRASGGQLPPGVDILRVESLGPNFGIGNRWTFKNGITLGVDWASWSQPLFTTKKEEAYLRASESATNPSDRNHIDTAVKLMQYMPRLTFLKLEVGYQF